MCWKAGSEYLPLKPAEQKQVIEELKEAPCEKGKDLASRMWTSR